MLCVNNAPINGLPQDWGVGQPRGNLTFSGFEISISPPWVFIISQISTPGDHIPSIKYVQGDDMHLQEV